MNIGRYIRGEDRHVGTSRTTKEVDQIQALIDSARPAEHFAFPPYRLVPADPKYPDDYQCIMNVYGFNCLTFVDRPGAVFAPKAIAEAIADKWNWGEHNNSPPRKGNDK